MAGTTRNDPLPAFVFSVKITGIGTAFFKAAGGLSYEVEVQPIKEGGVNNTTWQLPNSVKWKNITLKRGFTADSELLKWRNDWMSGVPKNMVRKDIVISQLDSGLQVVKQWSAADGFPMKWELSEYDASKNEVAIETLEIAHHGLTIIK